VADLALYTASGETGFWSVAMASRLAQLALVDCLFVAVSLARQESARSSIRRIRAAIALKRY
jgi:DNA-binding MurR/RpiR family transcriptional regulator